jgi:protein-S-isoprenylcysteine O-methyltransferase Ste14
MSIISKLNSSPIWLSFFYFLLFFIISALCYAITPETLKIQISAAFYLPGFVLIVLGFCIRYYAFKELLKFNKSVRSSSIPIRLIIAGVYKYSRNPAYLGVILMLVGSFFLYPSLTIGAIAIIFFIYLNLQVRREENTLSKKFRRAYSEYKKKTQIWV